MATPCCTDCCRKSARTSKERCHVPGFRSPDIHYYLLASQLLGLKEPRKKIQTRTKESKQNRSTPRAQLVSCGAVVMATCRRMGCPCLRKCSMSTCPVRLTGCEGASRGRFRCTVGAGSTCRGGQLLPLGKKARVFAGLDTYASR